MSSTRNKRKRSENEASTMTPAASRRRSREQRATAAPPTTTADEKKNEPHDDDQQGKSPKEGDAMVKQSVPSQGKQDSAPSSQAAGENTEISKNKVQTPPVNDSVSDQMQSLDKSTATTQEAAPPATTEKGSSATSENDAMKRRALHSSENAQGSEGEKGGKDRASRIRGMLSHRSLLLARIRLCRSAGESRLRNESEKKNDTKPESARKELTDEEEITRHLEMTTQATLAAKRSRAESDAGEKRTSLSLRRGSSVGKRMNAALSSLAPGSNTNPSEVASAQTILVPQSQSAKLANKAQHGGGSSPKAGQAYVASSAQGTKGPQHANIQPSKPIKSSSQIFSPKQQASSGIEGTQKSRSSSFKNTKSLNNNNRQSSAARLDPLVMPQHMGSIPAGLPHNRLAQAKVHFPEATALREKRNSIQARLRLLLESKQQHMHRSVEASAPHAHARRTALKTNEIQTRKPPKIPERRKTHWDSLLQEMSWMAADFIEERKWKISAARTIASTIPSPGMSVVSTPASRAVESAGEKSKNSNISQVGADSKDSLDSVKESVETKEKKRKKKSTRTKKTKEVNTRVYSTPTMEDANSSRNVGKVVSAMVAELANATMKSGAIAHTDEDHIVALERFRKTRSSILNENPITSESSVEERNGEVSINEAEVNKDDTMQSDKMDCDEDSTNVASSEPVEEQSFAHITHYIDSLRTSVEKARVKSSLKDITNALLNGKVALSTDQKEILDFAEKCWAGKSSPAGVVVSGNPVTGKTFAACCLIWKQRSKGPQIVVCPATSVVRWKHEIGRFTKMRVLTFGLSGGISSPESNDDFSKPEAGDVIVCELSSIHRLFKLTEGGLSSCESLVIDCRHSESFFESLSVSIEDDPTSSINRWQGPTELISTTWWDSIMGFLLATCTKLLLIEHETQDGCALSRSGLGEKQQLEIVASRAACIIGPKLFQSKNASIQRRVISWARQKGKSQIKDKVLRVRKTLESAVSSMSFGIPRSSDLLLDPIWDLRRCEMQTEQRLEYDKCCIEVRGALSSCISDKDDSVQTTFSAFDAISNALLRLRRQCFHTDAVENFCLPNLKEQAGGSVASGKSAAQPDAMLALYLMKGSAKLRKLASILKFECGQELQGEEVVKSLLEGQQQSSRKASSKRVAILSSCPEVQLLASLLLHALGIRHEFLQTDSVNRKCGVVAQSITPQASAIKWMNTQMILSDFNGSAGEDASSSNIIVANPALLAGWYQGLGVEAADIVITLDEDWTGRGDLVRDSVITKVLALKEFTKKEVSFVRLVCADTFEDKLFSAGESGVSTQGSNSSSWPCDPSGFLVLPESKSRASSLYEQTKKDAPNGIGQFPALNMLRFRCEMLADVLLPSIPFPPLLASGSDVQFLPTSSLQSIGGVDNNSPCNEASAELSLVRNLLGHEASMNGVALSENFALPKQASQSSDNGALCPFSNNALKDIMTRRDMKLLGTRLCFEKLCKPSVWTQTSRGPSAVYLAQLPKNASSGPISPSRSGAAAINNADPDAWGNSGLGCKREDFVSSLLFYRTSQQDATGDNKGVSKLSFENDEQPRLADGENGSRNAESKRRFNAYAKLFSGDWDVNGVKDGNQGCEPLVYFPPLFHGQVEYLAKAGTKPAAFVQKQAESVAANSNMIPPSENPTVKRKDAPVAAPPSAKRMRFQENSLPVPGTLMNTTVNGAAPHDATMTNALHPKGPELDPLLSKANQGPSNTQVHQDEKPFVPVVAASGSSGARSNKTTGEGESSLLDEDYGLLGTGHVALHAAQLASRKTIGAGFGTGCWSDSLPSDLEEFEAVGKGSRKKLDSMLLFVKKRSLPFLAEPHGRVYRPIQSHPTGDGWAGAHPIPGQPLFQGVGNAFSRVNGEEAGKKAKKRAPSQAALQGVPSSFARVPSNKSLPNHANMIQMSSGKDGHRHRLHASFMSRQFGTGLSMFESISYRLASLQVEKRVKRRFEELGSKMPLSHEAGLRLPHQSLHDLKPSSLPATTGWTKIIRPLDPKSSTGDAAKLFSSQQRLALKQSLISPSRVDFGPGGGYLATISGMTSISPPRSRLGVSLPMGVKVPQSLREQQRQQPLWTSETDTMLRESVVKFGTNWMLVSRAMTGSDLTMNKSLPHETHRKYKSFIASARQCRNRWQLLARTETSLSEEIRETEELIRKQAASRGNNFPSSGATVDKTKNGLALLQKKSFFNEEDASDNGPSKTAAIDPVKKANQAAQKKKSFAVLSATKSKRRYIPITIPGVVAGSQQNQPVPSHHSHMQSVQASVASQWSSGRTEMWPLQILDFTDKQRASATRTPAEAPPAVSTSTMARRPPSKTASRTPHASSAAAGRDRAQFPAVPASTSSRPPSSSHSRGVPGVSPPNRAPASRKSPSTAPKRSPTTSRSPLTAATSRNPPPPAATMGRSPPPTAASAQAAAYVPPKNSNTPSKTKRSPPKSEEKATPKQG